MRRLALLLPLLAPAWAWAQSSSPDEGPAPRAVEIDLPGARIDAEPPGPSARLVPSSPPLRVGSLIEVRASFNPAMELSLGEIR